jgi:hypothetical protein
MKVMSDDPYLVEEDQRHVAALSAAGIQFDDVEVGDD